MKSALLLVGLTTAVLTAGCADDSVSMTVLSFEALESASNCIAMATATDIRTTGVLDVSLLGAQGYVAFPVIRNNEVINMPFANAPDYNIIQIQGVDVSLKLPTELAGTVKASDLKFFVPAAVALDPGVQNVVQAEILPLTVVSQFAGSLGNSVHTVIASVRPVGVQNGDQMIGGPADFPVQVCDGCLIDMAGACPLSSTAKIGTGGCIPGQDDVLTCCKDPTTSATLCGSAVPIGSST